MTPAFSHSTHHAVIPHLMFIQSPISLTGVIQCCVDTVMDLHDQLHPSIVNIPLTNLLPAINFTQEQQGFNRALRYSIGRLTVTVHAHTADKQNCEH